MFSISSCPVDTVHFPSEQRTPGPGVPQSGTVVVPELQFAGHNHKYQRLVEAAVLGENGVVPGTVTWLLGSGSDLLI